MKTMSQWVLVVAGVGAFVGTASAAEKTKKPNAVIMKPVDLKWADLPKMAGIQMAVVDGNPDNGPAHFFVKFAAGTDAPMHPHTADYTTTVVSGTVVLTSEGKESTLPVGSFFSFLHRAPHGTRCTGTVDCIMFIDARGKWNFVPEKSDSKP